MASRMPFDPFSSVRPWDWWHGADALWRWGARLHELWLEEIADDATRESARRRRLASLLDHARTHSRFYARRHRRVPEHCIELDAFEPVTRSELMRHFGDWVTDPRIRLDELRRFVADPSRVGEPYLGRYAVWTSSGTSGVPGIYVQDVDALTVCGALLSLHFDFIQLADFRGFGSDPARLTLIAATGGHFAAVVWWQLLCRMHPAFAAQARVFSILRPLPELVDALQQWQPAALASYPTMLVQLAAEQRAGRLKIRPRSMHSGGESITDAERTEIADAFGCTLAEDYGASECMNIAHGCRCGRLHVNDGWVVLEPVDENLRAVPAGEPSFTVLLTNLANRVQPIIRYDLGDSVTADASPCACGSRHPSIGVSGRRDDVLEVPCRQASGLRILPLALETVLEDEAGLDRFQLTQTAADAMSLRIEARDERERRLAFRRASAALEHFLQAQGAAPVRLSLDPEPPKVSETSGKLRRICSRAARR